MRTCGLDECGRGALAGPLVAAGVVLACSRQKLARMAGVPLRDSKKLNKKQREKIYKALKKTKAEMAVEVISHRQVNTRGIGWANREIFRRLIRRLEADEYVADGTIKIGRVKGKKSIRSVVDADENIPPAIAAGIVAKVERDKIMDLMHREFPKYKWKNNTGHGTREHIHAIEIYGITKYHRSVFVTTALRNKKAKLETFES